MMAYYTHNIDPVLFSLGFIEIRWYGLAYVCGILLAWLYGRRLVEKAQITNLTPRRFDDFIVWATLGIILGGRIGDILFYHPKDLWKVWEYFYIWEPGRSFHGGLLGVVVAATLFSRKYQISMRPFADILGLVSPIGLFFGRLSNFVNGELWGRETSVSWAVIFPQAGLIPRHPSQLYEALGEGLGLFILLYCLSQMKLQEKRPGALFGVFLIGYAIARIITECFREPDAHIGYFFNVITMGQILSLPLLLIGLGLIIFQQNKEQKNG